MNLKEKAIEAKEYGEIKDELINLTDVFLKKYEEYEKDYYSICKTWSTAIITEFESIFKSEGFSIVEETSSYSREFQNYKTIRATLYDLEFELLIDKDEEIRFLQVKPETEEKNIIIRPIIEKYCIDGNYIKINSSARIYNDGNNKTSHAYDVECKYKKVKDAQFSLVQMKQFVIEVKKETDLLLNELERIKSIKVISKAIPIGKFGMEDKNVSYGEFEKLSELIEKI